MTKLLKKHFVRLTLLRIPKLLNCDKIEKTQNSKTEEKIVKNKKNLNDDPNKKPLIKLEKKIGTELKKNDYSTLKSIFF